MPTIPPARPVFRTIDLSAEVRRIWGKEWNAPEPEYEFTGRTFKRRTEEAAIYATSADHED